MYTKDGISVEEVSRIVDTFPNQGIYFTITAMYIL